MSDSNNTVINPEEISEIKPIVLKFTDTNQVYTLEFSRNTVAWAEKNGFPLNPMNGQDILSEKPMTVIEDLFYYAFQMHHRGMSKALTDKILYDDLGGLTSAMLERLVMLHIKTYGTLITDDESKPKNPTLAVEM